MKSYSDFILENRNILEMKIKLRDSSDGDHENVSKFIDEFHSNSVPHPFNRSRIFHHTSVELSKDGNQVHIHDLQSIEPNKGHGSKALHHLTKLSDKHNVKINLHAKAYSKDKSYITNSVKLGKWYHKHGFRFDDSEHKLNDHHDGADMTYYPR